jgi:putative endonuclease
VPEPRRTLGAASEQEAARFLERKGYRVVDRNLRSRWGEIDIIARDGDEVVFVEVKSARSGSSVDPVESAHARKLGRVADLAMRYLAGRFASEPAWRIDVVTVVLDERDKLVRLTHYPRAVE